MSKKKDCLNKRTKLFLRIFSVFQCKGESELHLKLLFKQGIKNQLTANNYQL